MALPKLDTPTYELKLPSNGKTVRFRPFLVKEHKVLLTMVEAEESEVARIIRELIDACTFGKLNVNELPHFDVEYIFMNLRAKSIGESVEVIVNCECGNKIETSFNIDDLVVEVPPGHSNKIMISDAIGVEMRYPTIDEVLSVFATNSVDKVMSLIVDNISAIYTKDDYFETKDQPRQDIEDFVFSLTKAQFDKLEEFFVTSPKIVQVVEADCPQCGKHNTSRLEGLQNFFV